MYVENVDGSMHFARTKWGLERFVPMSILGSTKRKTLRKQLVQHVAVEREVLIQDHSSSSTTGRQRHSAASLMLKMRYVNRLMKLQDFGGRYFDAALAVSLTICSFG